MLPVTHHTVSGVTTIAAFIVMRCATRRMTVEMEVMRKRSSVSKSPKGEGKKKGPQLSAVHKMYLWDFSLFYRGLSYACDCRSPWTLLFARLPKHTELRCSPSPFFLFHLDQMLESSLRKWEQILNSGLSPTWKTNGLSLFKDEVWSLFSLELLIVHLGMGTSQCPAEKLMFNKAALVFTGLI